MEPKSLILFDASQLFALFSDSTSAAMCIVNPQDLVYPISIKCIGIDGIIYIVPFEVREASELIMSALDARRGGLEGYQYAEAEGRDDDLDAKIDAFVAERSESNVREA